MGEAARRKALPSLADWLKAYVPPSEDTGREAFDDLVTFVDNLLKLQPNDNIKAEYIGVRTMQALMLAIVETSCMASKQGFDPHIVLAMQADNMGKAFGYVFAGMDWIDDTPIRRLAMPFVEDFRRGLKSALDHAEDVT